MRPLNHVAPSGNGMFRKKVSPLYRNIHNLTRSLLYRRLLTGSALLSPPSLRGFIPNLGTPSFKPTQPIDFTHFTLN